MSNEQNSDCLPIQKRNELTIILKRLNKCKDSANRKVALSRKLKELLATPIDKIDFSPRIKSVFWNTDINKVADIVRYSGRDFNKLRNIGKKSGHEVERFLESKGLSWQMKI
jgi:DNA-directed RNA polymerase alpha subunit